MKKQFLTILVTLTAMMSFAQTEPVVPSKPADTTKTKLKFNPELVVSSNYIWRGAIFADKPFVTLCNTATYGNFSMYGSFDYAPFNDNMFDLFAMPTYKVSNNLSVSANYFYWGNYINNTVIAKHYLDITVKLYDFVEVGAMVVDPYRTDEYAKFAAITKKYDLNKNYSVTPRLQTSLSNNAYYGEVGKFAAEAMFTFNGNKNINWATFTVGYTNNELNYYTFIDVNKPQKFYANLSIALF